MKQKNKTQLNAKHTVIKPKKPVAFNPVQKKKGRVKVSSKEDRTYDGIVYDSKTEMLRGIELINMEKAGLISNLQRQVSFELQEGFIDCHGKRFRPITYVCDFMYEQDGAVIVEDVKSKLTVRFPDYKLKKKMFMYKYRDYLFYENIR